MGSDDEKITEAIDNGSVHRFWSIQNCFDGGRHLACIHNLRVPNGWKVGILTVRYNLEQRVGNLQIFYSQFSSLLHTKVNGEGHE